MPRLEYGRRLNKNIKAPKLTHAKPMLRDKIKGFARRLKLARKSKTLEEQHALFREMQTAIKEDKKAFEGSVRDIIAQKTTRFQGSATVDAMFGFLKGMKRGVIPKTEESLALEKKITAFSDRLAFELEKANLSPSAQQEKRAYLLIDLLMNEGKPKPEAIVGQNLLRQKKEISNAITEFINKQALAE